ncbi:UNVERIFIED_CONTAM: hypothetical protein H355_012540, partial [Colinus virginianus]
NQLLQFQGSSLDAGIMVSNLLLEMQSCTKIEFQLNEQYGEELNEDAWQYIFAIDLLCSHLKWDWTHDNVISKVLWPSMDKWIKKRKEHETAQCVPDSIIALILRLIGRLGQIGLKEGYLSAVKNISSVIGLFVQHAKEEGNVYLEELKCKICSKQNEHKLGHSCQNSLLVQFCVNEEQYKQVCLSLPKIMKPGY